MLAYPLKGGLDLRTASAQVNPGTLQDCLNYEVSDVAGYSRIAGFERFDGRFRVPDFRACRLLGTPQSGTFSAGDVVIVAGVVVVVTRVNPASLEVLRHARDPWPMTVPVTAVNMSRVGSMQVTETVEVASPVGHQVDVNQARKYLASAPRAAVQPVPGDPSKPVAGLFRFKGTLYAIRDYPQLWFESEQRWPFRVGDAVALPGGVYTILQIAYTSDAYQAGRMVLYPVSATNVPMLSAPQPGVLITRNVAGGEMSALSGAPLAAVPLGVLEAAASSQTTANVVTAPAQSSSGLAPRAAQSIAGLWSAGAAGWRAVDLKRQVQFAGGTQALGDFLTQYLTVSALPAASPATHPQAATFNGADCSAAFASDTPSGIALSGGASDELMVIGFDFGALPATATILGITVTLDVEATSGAVQDSVIELVGVGAASVNKASSTAWPVTAGNRVYGGAADTWGTALTPDIINAAGFGVRVVTLASGASPAGRINAATVVVTYRQRFPKLYATSGTTTVSMTLIDAQMLSGAWADGDAAGWLVIDTGSQPWVSTLSNGMALKASADGSGATLATLAGMDAPNWLPGWDDLQANRSRYEFVATNFYGMADYQAMYGVSGASPAWTYDGDRFAWIRTPMAAALDLPRHIARHGASLVLGYYQGAYILSVVGQPTNFRGEDGAVSIEIGENLTNLMTAIGDALLVTSRTQTYVLHGLDPSSYQQDVLSGNRGALEYTAGDVGRLLVTDQLGIAAADATPAFGDFARTYVSMAVESWLAGRLRSASPDLQPICALPVRFKNQYRLFFADGYVLTMTANEPPEFTLQRYFIPASGAADADVPLPLACVTTGVADDGAERVFASFTAADKLGYVFELDSGTTFDGGAIPAHITLNPLSFNGDANGGLSDMTLKRFDRVFVQGMAEGFARLALSRRVDQGMPDGTKASQCSFGPADADASKRVVRGVVDAPIEGYEVTIRIDSSSDAEGPHTLQVIATTASTRGDSRGHVRG